MPNLVELMKTAALEAVADAAPVSFLYGVVESAAPLTVRIDQKILLDQDFLLLTGAVADHTVELEGDQATEQGGNPAHSHALRGKKSYRACNGLRAGEQVLLLRMQGGQKYVVLDRLVMK